MTKKYLGETKEMDVDGEKITIGQYSYATQKKISQLTVDGDNLGAVDYFLKQAIKDWTLTDEAGKKLEIKREVFDTLSGAFIAKILEEAVKFNNLTADNIKNLSGRLEPQLQKQV